MIYADTVSVLVPVASPEYISVEFANLSFFTRTHSDLEPVEPTSQILESCFCFILTLKYQEILGALHLQTSLLSQMSWYYF